MMARRREIGLVYLTGLVQGVALVTFPAASSILPVRIHRVTGSATPSMARCSFPRLCLLFWLRAWRQR